jgi:two-component system nitrogen regulation response regulator GlnG
VTAPLDRSTIKHVARDAAGPPRRPSLTLLFHPDVARVGEIAALGPGRTAISRRGPAFGRRDGRGTATPLGDPHLSRREIATIEVAGDAWIVHPAGQGARVDGEPLSAPRELARDGEAVLELADRIVLLLHGVGPPRESSRAFGLVGESDALEDVRAHIGRVADLNVGVLLLGETGVGKELVARAIHDAGPRAARPFVAVNMAAVPPALAASELFGHARGAFTGAAHEHRGCFERADGGTLFLDEIGDTPAEVQAMLLRTLETGELQPLGAATARRVDVRPIAATDADLGRAVAEGRFRSPLLHRVSGYELAIPPLRARRDDVARLFVHFLRRELATVGEAHRLAPPPPGEAPCIAASSVALLARYAWPGNVRELQNAVRQIVIFSRGRPELLLDDGLRRKLTAAPAAAAAPAARRDPAAVGDEELVAALAAHGWSPGAAAAALGISKTTIYHLIDASPSVRKARDLTAEDVAAARQAAGDDVDALAAHLRVSPRGLRLRMRELKI